MIHPSRCPVMTVCSICHREVGLGPNADEHEPVICLSCGPTVTRPAEASSDQITLAMEILRGLPPGSGSGWAPCMERGISREAHSEALSRILKEEALA